MTARSPRQSAEQWSRIIAEFEQSGLDKETFCHRRHLASSTFNRWRLRFSNQPHAEVARSPTVAPFVEALPAGGETITITASEHIRLDCPVSVGMEQIAQLAQALVVHERS